MPAKKTTANKTTVKQPAAKPAANTAAKTKAVPSVKSVGAGLKPAPTKTISKSSSPKTFKPAPPKAVETKPVAEKSPSKPSKSSSGSGKPAGVHPEERRAKATSGKQKIRIRIRSFDHTVIDQAVQTIITSAEQTGAFIAGPIPLPTKIKKITINRSTFVKKDARDQFEVRHHGRLIDVLEPTQKTVESLSNLNLPSGVDIEIKMLQMS